MSKVIICANQKGGVAKTTTTLNVGIGLARLGKKVLLIDNDPQGSLTEALGYQEPDRLETTLAQIMEWVLNEEDFDLEAGILHHEEGVDLMPANIELSGVETSLIGIMSSETVLKDYISLIGDKYDYILVDCSPNLGQLTLNALVAADEVIIPVQAAYLPIKGLEQLLKTISRVKRKMNPKLHIMGILLTMVDYRTNYASEITDVLYNVYGASIHIFDTSIPMSVRAAETPAIGVSIYKHDAKGKDFYRALPITEEYMAYMKSYNMVFAENKNQLVSRVITADTSGMLEDLGQIMDNHIVDKDARRKLEELIQRIKYFGEQELFDSEEHHIEKMVCNEPAIKGTFTGEIDPTPESLDPSIHFKAADYNDGALVTVDDMQRIQIKIQFLNQNHVIVDEALFATSNIRQAVYDYLCRRAFIKKIGLYVNEKDITLYSSKNASLSVAVLTPEMRKIKNLDKGVQGQLVTFYEEQIKKTMIELSQ